jgi:hypothetical protein
MDPISLMMGVTSLIGVGTSLFGASKSSGAAGRAAEIAGQEAQVSGQIAQSEMQINAQRRQQMVLDVGRQQLQTVRNAQLARSMAISASVNQGAQFGTGIAGGVSQIAAQGAQDTRNLSQNFEIGKNVFDLNDQIDKSKITLAKLGGDMASAQGDMAQGQGIQQLGAGIMSAASPMSKFFGSMPGMFGSTGGSGGGYANPTSIGGLY